VTRLGLLFVCTLQVPAWAEGDAPVYQSTVHSRPKRDQEAPGTIVITARELQQRNVQNLAEALDLIPELSIRQGGMGIRLDLRGAKQRSVLLLIDGIPIDEPYFGAFDLTAIPITDIVEIRVQLTPASPLEGPGGDGGLIEVTTLRAVGQKRIDGRLVSSSNPEVEGALTGRVPLKKDQTVGLRLSTGARYANPRYPVIDMSGAHQSFADEQVQAYGAARLEYQGERGRVALDGWYGHRSFDIPPSDSEGSTIQHVTREDAGRVVLGGEANPRGVRIAVGAYGEILSRDTDMYLDYTLTNKVSHQELFTGRAGAALTLDKSWVRGDLRATLTARASADGEGAQIKMTNQPTTYGISTYAMAAIGTHIRWRMLRAEAALGALIPFDNPGGLWPEAKLGFGVEPNRWMGFWLVGARKGRLPTVRELYDPTQGNSHLDPEQTLHGELRLDVHPHPLVDSHTTAYLKQIDGFIRIDPSAPVGMGRNVNLDTITVRGVEAAIDVARERIFGGGVAYLYQDASSHSLGLDPVPNMPGHRVDAYLASSWKRRVGALLRFRWVSDRLVQGARLDPYHDLDLTIWGRLTNAIRASLRIDNLSNQHYQQLPNLRVLGTNATLTVEGVWE
jgi:outer membrane cobalamin receptor